MTGISETEGATIPSVLYAAAERYGGEQREQCVHARDDADRPLVGAEREGPVGDGGAGHRHRPLREAEGDDEAEQPAAVPAGRHGEVPCPVGRMMLMPRSVR